MASPQMPDPACWHASSRLGHQVFAYERRLWLLPMIDFSVLALGDGSWLATLPADPQISWATQPEVTLRALDPPPDSRGFVLQHWAGRIGWQVAYLTLFNIPIRELADQRLRLGVRLPRHRRVRIVWVRLAERLCRLTRLAVALQLTLISAMFLFDLVSVFQIPFLPLPTAALMVSLLLALLVLKRLLPRPGRPRQPWPIGGLRVRDAVWSELVVKKLPATHAPPRQQRGLSDDVDALSHLPGAGGSLSASVRRPTVTPGPAADPKACPVPGRPTQQSLLNTAEADHV